MVSQQAAHRNLHLHHAKQKQKELRLSYVIPRGTNGYIHEKTTKFHSILVVQCSQLLERTLTFTFEIAQTLRFSA